MIALARLALTDPAEIARHIGAGVVEVVEPGKVGALGAVFGEAVCAALAGVGVAAISPEAVGARYAAAGCASAAAAAALIRREIRRKGAALVIVAAGDWRRCSAIRFALYDAVSRNRPVFAMAVAAAPVRFNQSEQGAAKCQ
jgi:hypothetical protein